MGSAALLGGRPPPRSTTSARRRRQLRPTNDAEVTERVHYPVPCDTNYEHLTAEINISCNWCWPGLPPTHPPPGHFFQVTVCLRLSVLLRTRKWDWKNDGDCSTDMNYWCSDTAWYELSHLLSAVPFAAPPSLSPSRLPTVPLLPTSSRHFYPWYTPIYLQNALSSPSHGTLAVKSSRQHLPQESIEWPSICKITLRGSTFADRRIDTHIIHDTYLPAIMFYP